MRRWQGWKALAHEVVDSVVDLVEEGHESTSRAVLAAAALVPGALAPAREIDALRRAATSGVLDSIRAANRVAARVSDLALEAALGDDDAGGEEVPVPMRSDIVLSAAVALDQLGGVLNGIAGDSLAARGNPLAEPLRLRWRDLYLPRDRTERRAALAGATPRIAVFVHGLATSEWSWCLNAVEHHGDAHLNFGTLLARDLGYSPVWVRYNSGLPIDHNGAELAEQLESLLDAWPEPVESLVLIGHSMGGLVARAACARESRWRESVSHVFCLGSPHDGADLERGGELLTRALLAVDHPATRVLGRIGDRRSAGIKDLRHGLRVTDTSAGSFTCHYIGGTLSEDPDHPVARMIGDLLVRLPSAHARLAGDETVLTSHVGGVMHQNLSNHPAVYREILRTLSRRGR